MHVGTAAWRRRRFAPTAAMPDLPAPLYWLRPLSSLAPPARARAIRTRRAARRVAAILVIASLVTDVGVLPRDWQTSRRVAIELIEVYQARVSPLIRSRVVCRFTPSCSEYARECFVKMTFLPALWATIDRLSRCNERTPMGSLDPAP